MAEKSSRVTRSSSDAVPGVLDQRELAAIVTCFQKSNIEESLPGEVIDTCTAVTMLVDTLMDLPISPPSLYVDLEGVQLSRQGTISILQVFALPLNRTFLVDIHTLKEKAFSSAGTKGQTLRRILESDTIPKAFFDVRNDSDALYSHFNIELSCIHDIQLMELATRTFSRRRVNGLTKCIERDAPMTIEERTAWSVAKEKGVRLFAPERGGTYEVFNTRPLPKEIMDYCVQDVQFLPKLWSHYSPKLTRKWSQKLVQATRDRVALSQAASYNGHGCHKTLAPEGWA